MKTINPRGLAARRPRSAVERPCYISAVLRRVCRKFDIKVIFKSGRTLRSVLTTLKDTLPPVKLPSVVYQIPCTCGKVYIGETGQRLETQIREHQDDCNRGMTGMSVVAEHAWGNQHCIDWEGTSVINRTRRSTELMLNEALHIQMTPAEEQLNCDGGLELP